MGARGPVGKLATATTRPPADPLQCPEWLHERAAAVWRETEPALRQAGRIGPEHADLLGQYCSVVAELRHLSRLVAAEGPVVAGSATAAVKLAARLRGTLAVLARSLALDVAVAARLDTLPQAADEGPDLLQAFAMSRSDRSGAAG